MRTVGLSHSGVSDSIPAPRLIKLKVKLIYKHSGIALMENFLIFDELIVKYGVYENFTRMIFVRLEIFHWTHSPIR